MFFVLAQDTLHFVYSKSAFNSRKGSLFTGKASSYFYSIPKKSTDYWVVFIEHDTSRFEIHWKGSKRELFSFKKYITNINYITPLIGEDQYAFTISDTNYSLKKVKGEWGCFAGNEKILSIDFYKEAGVKKIRLITKYNWIELDYLLLTTLYCVDELIENKRTKFGKALLTQAIIRSIK